MTRYEHMLAKHAWVCKDSVTGQSLTARSLIAQCLA
jgi:hypothetical protein